MFVWARVLVCVARWLWCIAAANISSCDICVRSYVHIFVRARLPMQFDPRVAPSSASATPICGRKPIPLGELDPKSYDWVYANHEFKCVSVCCHHGMRYTPYKRLSEGFVKTAASAVRQGVVVLASHAGPGRLTTALTTTPVSMGLNSPICLARELLTQGGNLQRLSFPLPSSLVCLFIFLFVFMLPACPSFHQPRCHNDSRPTARCSAAVAFINCELRHPNYHLQREQWLALIGWGRERGTERKGLHKFLVCPWQRGCEKKFWQEPSHAWCHVDVLSSCHELMRHLHVGTPCPYIIMFYYNHTHNKFVEWYIIPQISRKTTVYVILKPYYTADTKMKKNHKLYLKKQSLANHWWIMTGCKEDKRVLYS